MIQMILFFTLAYECREKSDYLFCILFSDYIILLGQEYGNCSVEMGVIEVNFFDDLLSKKKIHTRVVSEQSFLVSSPPTGVLSSLDIIMKSCFYIHNHLYDTEQ